MTAFPKVAVVTPVYNGSEFLREAMLSVQAQTYPNLVHFVLNNASTDATPDIIDEFRDARVPVTVVRNDNTLPLGDNWNRAVALGSKGSDYFRILCADDTIPNDGVSKMVALAEADPGISVVASLRETAKGVEEFGWDRTRSVFGGREAVRACFLDGNGLAPPHVMYRTERALSRERFFNDDIIAFDTDAVFFLLVQPNAKLGFIHQPLGYTRRHDGSVTEKQTLPFHKDYFDWFVLMSRYAKLALNPYEFSDCKSAYRRHYLRRMLTWRWSDDNDTAYRWHVRALTEVGQKPRITSYIDAIADYALCKIGIRDRWTQYPQG